MRVTNAIIYYFSCTMIVLTLLLSLLLIKKVRHFIFNSMDRFKINEDLTVFKLLYWVLFSVIIIVAFNSGKTYFDLKQLSKASINKEIKIDTLINLKLGQKEDKLEQFSILRQFSMADRNLMLVGSTLIIMLIFNSFFQAFKRLYLIEVQHNNKIKVV